MADKKIEKRNFELRAESQGDEFAIAGYAALYNNLSKDLGGFREIIAPGAFDRSLREGGNVNFCFNHSQDDILARTDNGTLKLSSDAKGLKFYAQLNRKIQRHVDIFEACRAKLYRECSFAFQVPEGGDKVEQKSGVVLRTLLDVDLLDASLVGTPAYPNTAAAARNLPGKFSAQETADLLAKAEAMLQDWANQERAYQIGLQIAGQKRDADGDYDEDGTPSARDIESFLAARFGKSRAGHASKYALIEHEVSAMADGSKSGVALCMDMDAPQPLSRVRIRFVIDPYGKVTFSDPEDERAYLASLQIA